MPIWVISTSSDFDPVRWPTGRRQNQTRFWGYSTQEWSPQCCLWSSRPNRQSMCLFGPTSFKIVWTYAALSAIPQVWCLIIMTSIKLKMFWKWPNMVEILNFRVPKATKIQLLQLAGCSVPCPLAKSIEATPQWSKARVRMVSNPRLGRWCGRGHHGRNRDIGWYW